MKEEFLKICNEVFGEEITHRIWELNVIDELSLEDSVKQAKEEYNEKFSELCDRLMKLFI